MDDHDDFIKRKDRDANRAALALLIFRCAIALAAATMIYLKGLPA